MAAMLNTLIWKQPICDAIMRRIKCRQGITVAEIIDEIGAPNEHREELVCMIYSLMSVLQRRGVASMLPDPADHPSSNEMRLDKPSRKYGKRLPKKSRPTTIPTPTWPCPYCGFIHYARDLVRLDNERLECCQCGQAFTPAKAADSQAIGFRDSD